MSGTGVTCYDLNKEGGIKNRLPNLRYHVFISKETTKELSDYILPEPWGDENGLLYKYLDYVWRCQLFDRQIKKFYCRSEHKLVFHSGLQRRSDGEFVYLLLIRNDADSNKKVDQKWRVALGIQNGLHSRNMSFVTKHELLKHYWRYDESLLPKRTLFYKCEKDLIFNTTYRFDIDWEERLRTCKNRIYKTLSNDGNRKGASCNIDESVLPIKELQRRFESETMKSIALSRANPRIGVPQAFIESKNAGYRLELLIPLTLYFNNRAYYFALALRPHHDDCIYEGMSILTREMAYANARLVGSIDSSWLNTRFASDNIGAAHHCSCTCHNFCNLGINPHTVHNLADHQRKYNNDIPHDRHDDTMSSKGKASNKPLLNANVNSGNSNSNSNAGNLQFAFNHSSSNSNSNSIGNSSNGNNNNYHNLNNMNSQIRNNVTSAPFMANNMAQHINVNRMNGISPISIQNYMSPNTPNPYSLPIQSPNPSGTPSCGTLKNGALSATTNPFSFVPPNANQAWQPMATNGNLTSYTPGSQPTATGPSPYNFHSLFGGTGSALNAALLASVPNVGPPGTGLKTPLFTHTLGSTPQHNSNISPVRATPSMQLQATKPPLAFFGNATSSGVPSVGNSSLGMYGIPTIGPPGLANSSAVTMPIAPMSGPQSMGSVNSSVPLYASAAVNPKQNASNHLTPKSSAMPSNSVNLSTATNNALTHGHSHSNSNSNSSNTSNISNSNANLNISKKRDGQSNVVQSEKDDTIALPKKAKNSIPGKAESKPSNSELDKQKQVRITMPDQIEQKPTPPKQGFTDDMFADASPRTKEVFTGLTFDEEDEVYSLQPSRNKNKGSTSSSNGAASNATTTANGSGTGTTDAAKSSNHSKIAAMRRAKSFHTTQHLPSYTSLSVMSKTPNSHPIPSPSSWKSAHSQQAPQAHSNTNSPLLSYASHASRQHSYDTMHRAKSMVMIQNKNQGYYHEPGPVQRPHHHHAHHHHQAPLSHRAPYQQQQQQQPPPPQPQQQQQQQRPLSPPPPEEDVCTDVYAKSYYASHAAVIAPHPAAEAPPYTDSAMFPPYDGNEKIARMTKSHSQPSLADMMQMHVEHQSFQEFQQMNQQSNSKKTSSNDHEAMMNMYRDD
eukprot:CAMPEP_0197046756 /NCGR_PEP_ID=MMETSP1384-20130603/22402_1 /TAXON_ID=29189 /ORGANISM="Ammonia sp." /LENGTH=1123 /DNA_ID=CAMNT_0042478591 /DNA_START=106 /DNA_END=3477 /DNA_ORIENTATION=-